MNTVKSQWELFEAAAVPPDASAVQCREMRRAFYGGAWAVLCMVWMVLVETNAEESVEAMVRLRAECEAFALKVRRRQA